MRPGYILFYWGLLVVIFLALCPACKNGVVPDPTPDAYPWKKLADTSAWAKSYNFQLLTIHDTLWVMHTDGNWFSTDGNMWTKSSLPNVIGNLAFLDYIFFQNKLFGLGHFDGNIQDHSLRPTIYFSTDRIHWDSIINTNLQKRYFYHPVVFNDKLWIVGGEDESNIYADIITSTDGLHWQIIKDNLPFGPVTGTQLVVFKNKLWMFSNDVWSSGDGTDWTQVSKAILPNEKIFGYTVVVFDEKIWLIGCNRNEEFTSHVLVSDDGIHWTSRMAPWTPRGGVAAASFGDRIIMTGGKYGGTPHNPEFVYSNDIWEMTKQP